MKRIISFLLVFACLLGLCGCSALQELEPQVELRYEKPYIGLAQTVDDKDFSLEQFVRISVEEMEAHQPVWGIYATDVYYAKLDDTAQRIYRILCYAMDTEQPYVLIDDRLLQGTAFSLQDILDAMALDSPLVEQNLEWRYSEFTSTVTHPQLLGDPVEEKLTGQYLYVSDFESHKLQKKRQAVEKAESVIKSLPQNTTPRQRAQDIYTWLGKNVQYFNTSVDREKVDYLYDALCVGRSNCDGFANAFTLMCYLSGIRCCEKLSDPPKEGEEGHTWNAVELDGVWYNVDATAADEVTQEKTLFLHFGFGDHRQDPYLWRPDLSPICDKELFAYDCTLKGEKDAGKTLKAALKKTDRDYLIVYVESGKLSKAALQDIANTTNHDITSYYSETGSGAAVCYIYFD